MTHIFCLTHGDWGEALLRSVEQVIGPTKGVHCFPIGELDSSRDYEAALGEAVEALGGSNIVMIADFLGGSPYLAGVRVCHRHRLPLITGLSMELMILLCTQPDLDCSPAGLQEIISRATGRTVLIDTYLFDTER